VAVSWLTKLFVQLGLVGAVLPGVWVHAAAMMRSASAVVVTDTEVVVVPADPAIVDVLETSNGVAVFPLYSHAVMAMVSGTDGVQVTVDSVPSLIRYQM